MSTRPNENDLITFAVKEMALQIFADCGAPDDFCVQTIGASLVFGGANRLILSEYGWRIDEAYCTPRFIERFKEKYEVRR